VILRSTPKCNFTYAYATSQAVICRPVTVRTLAPYQVGLVVDQKRNARTGLSQSTSFLLLSVFCHSCSIHIYWSIVIYTYNVISVVCGVFNPLAPMFYIYILAHSVCKMWIIHEPKKVALWNKRHFEEKNGECVACLKYSIFIFVEKIYKMQHLNGSGTPVLYIGHTVLKG
jgi:hypothetical protein